MEDFTQKKIGESLIKEPIRMYLHQLNQEYNLRFFTGFQNHLQCAAIFNHLKKKAAVMTYRDGIKKIKSSKKAESANDKLQNLLDSADFNFKEDVEIELQKAGPSRKLRLDQEFLIIMMKLRLGLLTNDLAFHFQVSQGKVSQIIITWIKLMSRELGVLIVWPSKGQISATLPACFKQLYPRVQVIIDCTEIFSETPSSLEVQAALWSDHKHHCTLKYLIAITPTGAISWVSPGYGGR